MPEKTRGHFLTRQLRGLITGLSISWFVFSGISDAVFGQESGQGGLPSQAQAMLDGLRQKVDRQAELAKLLSRAESHYREGEALAKSGQREMAQERLALAREMILSSEEDIFYEPGVHTYFLSLTRRMGELLIGPVIRLPDEGRLALSDDTRIQSFVKYFQGKGRKTVSAAFNRLAQYEPMMRRIFREEDVPEELIFLGLVESAYNPYAQSDAGARGIWQFVRDTGRRYGLKQAGGVDERHDPEKSTRAAARYLRDLYGLFADWHLALAAYNAGEYRVLKAIKQTGSKDYWQIRSRNVLPQETMNYVPAVLAAIIVGKEEFRSHADKPDGAAQIPASGVWRVGKRY